MSIGMSAFYALYGYQPLSFANVMFGASKAPSAKIWIQESQDILRALKDNMATAQNQQKLYANKGRVERWIGQVAYELALPQGSKIHNVFHVSCLKKALGQHVTVTDELPPTDDEGDLVLQPEAIIDTRERQLWSRTVREFLVRWKNLPDEDATWERENFAASITSVA
eukprot:PITA_23768